MRSLPGIVAAVIGFTSATLAIAEPTADPGNSPAETGREASPKKTKPPKRATRDEEPGKTADKPADNSAKNRDESPTAEQQGNSKAELELTRKIRRSIVSDHSLSSYAHNVKIIGQNGVVTLKGPVRTEEEKLAVEKKAAAVAGDANVRSELEVSP